MPIGYQLVHARNPKTGQKGYAARVVRGKTLNRHALAEVVADEAGVSLAEVAAVLSRLGIILARELKDGNALILDGIGTLKVTIGSKVVIDPAEFDARLHIKSARLRVRPDSILRKVLATADFKSAKPRPSANGSATESADIPDHPPNELGGRTGAPGPTFGGPLSLP